MAHVFNELRILPEPLLHGIAYVAYHAAAKPAFLNGEILEAGSIFYFPVVFTIKTPLGGIAFLLLGLVGVCMMLFQSPRSSLSRWCVALLAVALFYSIASMVFRVNIGYRHFLPVILLMASAASFGLNWLRNRARIFGLLAGICLLASAVEVLLQAPRHLSFINLAWGGHTQGHRLLADSSHDWGQNLPALRNWLFNDRDPESPVYLSYFGTVLPAQYGIEARNLPGFLDTSRMPPHPRLEPGTYIVSSTMLKCLYCRRFSGKWNAAYEAKFDRIYPQLTDTLAGTLLPDQEGWLRHARMLACLRLEQPDEVIADTFLVYYLEQDELSDLLDPDSNCLSRNVDLVN